MKESLSQTLTQRMQQRLSPLQMRLVRMLEMSEPEVEEEVRRELDENPALERADSPDGHAGDEEAFGETAEQMQMADYSSEEEIPFYRLEARNRSADDRYVEPVAVDGGEGLMESLLAQLRETDIPEEDIPVATYIIGSLDPNGYMTRTLPQIADDLAFGAGIDVDMPRLTSILDRVRALDPAGVGAFDLRDCLLLQLRRKPQTEPVRLATEIIGHYFDLFSSRRFEKLQSALGVDAEQLREAEETIRSLDPKPGGRLSEEADDRTRHIVPDFNVEASPDGVVTVTMPGNIPELTIEESFRPGVEPVRDTDGAARRREALSFITRRREEASDFIELLRLRRRTLMKVMEAIVSIQRPFFISEDEADLRPMVLRDVAEKTGFDLSVISRATAGKYVATQSAIYPLKFFFNEGVARTETDSDASTRAVTAALKRIVDEEDAIAPLSDEALLLRLRAEGFDLARRTVAKYRDRLGIPVARLRKKLQ